MILLALFVFTSLTLLIAIPILAQTGGGYDLTWSTIDGGGGTSSNAGYSLSGTIGQHDAGLSFGGSYTLAGGFWAGAGGPTISLPVFLPVVQR
jgi:hypothetical protein